MAEIFWPFPPEDVIEWPGTRPAGWADHIGTDFAIPQGTPLRASMSGTVDIIWNDGLGAWVIDIINPDGTVARHGHLSYMAPADGSWVNAGDYIGNTGGAIGTVGAGMSTGSHLHWELRNNPGWSAWGWFDPRDLNIHSFDKPAAATAPTPVAATNRKKNKMLCAYYKDAAGKGKGRWAFFGPNFWLEIEKQENANAFAAQLGGISAVVTDAGGWAKFKRVSGA